MDFNELVSAFTCLVGGSKSDKLSYAFEIFDEEGTGLLSRQQLGSYLCAFLTMVDTLASLGKGGGDADRRSGGGGGVGAATMIPRGELRREACVDLVDQIFVSSQPPPGAVRTDEATTHISFEQFGQWYTTGGYNEALWLELIDGRKWPQPQLTPPPTSTNHSSASNSSNNNSNNSSNNNNNNNLSLIHI